MCIRDRLVLIIVMTIASPSFLNVTNIFNILKQNAVYGVLAVGMTFVIVTGGIDLSVGSIVAVSYTHLDVYKRQECYYPKS